jgi:molybdenum cofactor guanylyltransferase
MTGCQSYSPRIKAMVLAGGKSRRLGQDKVLLHYSGATLLRRSVDLLRSLEFEVVISGRDPELAGPNGATPDVDAPWLPDVIEGVGPMGGIISGLRHFFAPLLVIACDLPLLDASVLLHLQEHRRSRPEGTVMTTFVQEDTGFIESLVAVYEPEALPLLEASCEAGVYKLSRALPRESRHELPYGPEQRHCFFNINYPHDLEQLRQLEPTFQEASCP